MTWRASKPAVHKNKDLSRQPDEDPFDSITDKIPARPVSVAEVASYSLVILAGLAVAGAAAYAVFKELIFEPKEYKIFGKALERAQHDHQAMAQEEGEGRYLLRPLSVADNHKGKEHLKRLQIVMQSFMQLLGQLTIAGEVADETFAKRMEYLEKLGDDHHVAVIEDLQSSKIVATGSILIEHKFARNCGKVGHLEDVVVDHTVRGQHLGQRIIDFLTRFAQEKGCYKVILDCSTDNAAFYEKCGYKRKEIQMAKYF